jgi:hypothetical protein
MPLPTPTRHRRGAPVAGAAARTALVAIALGALCAACSSGPVTWEDPVASGAGTPMPQEGASAADTAGLPADAARCPASLVRARAGGDEYAAWWRVAADSNVTLVAAHRAGTGAWDAPVAVDTVDQGRRGCDRPAPAIAADAASGYVHLVYFIDAPEGAGVFFSHSMERGAMYHSPVGVVYGDAPSRAAVAARGDTVAVAYEDPGRDPDRGRPTVGMALSVTSGHIFETRGVPVTAGDAPATRPAIALLPGRRVLVTWAEPGAPGGAARRRARAGVLR